MLNILAISAIVLALAGESIAAFAAAHYPVVLADIAAQGRPSSAKRRG